MRRRAWQRRPRERRPPGRHRLCHLRAPRFQKHPYLPEPARRPALPGRPTASSRTATPHEQPRIRPGGSVVHPPPGSASNAPYQITNAGKAGWRNTASPSKDYEPWLCIFPTHRMGVHGHLCIATVRCKSNFTPGLFSVPSSWATPEFDRGSVSTCHSHTFSDRWTNS